MISKNPIDAYLLNNKISLMYHVTFVQSKKISRDDFVSNLRTIVGDNVLASAMYNIHFKVANLFFLEV